MFKITSYYINEHTDELVLYVDEAIFCTISNVYDEEEAENIISDIEWEQNLPITNPNEIESIKQLKIKNYENYCN